MWAVPVVVFLATFGVFSVRHPGSVRAAMSNPQTFLFGAAALVCVGIAAWASQFRPKIRPVLPFVVALGVLGAAVYAEVPFERTSTQNRTLVDETVVESPTATTSAPSATRVAAGELRGINHSASGDVSIIRSSAGERVVRFAGFRVQGSPEPVLYVIEGTNLTKPGGTNLGAFTATDGDQLDVALPGGVEPTAGWTVLIWCEKFDVAIANATLG